MNLSILFDLPSSFSTTREHLCNICFMEEAGNPRGHLSLQKRRLRHKEVFQLRHVMGCFNDMWTGWSHSLGKQNQKPYSHIYCERNRWAVRWTYKNKCFIKVAWEELMESLSVERNKIWYFKHWSVLQVGMGVKISSWFFVSFQDLMWPWGGTKVLCGKVHN